MGTVTVDLAAKTAERTGPDAAASGSPSRPTSGACWTSCYAIRAAHQPGQLLAELRGQQGYTDSSYLRIYIAQLRRKLEAEPSRPRHLITEPGMGYRFQP